MIQIDYFRRLGCDNCNQTYADSDVSPCEIIRKKANYEGWKRKRVNGKMLDLCPNCQAPAAEEE